MIAESPVAWGRLSKAYDKKNVALDEFQMQFIPKLFRPRLRLIKTSMPFVDLTFAEIKFRHQLMIEETLKDFNNTFHRDDDDI